MTNEEFRFWIGGYQELSDSTRFSENQIQIIKNHADLVVAVTGILESDIQEFIKSLEY